MERRIDGIWYNIYAEVQSVCSQWLITFGWGAMRRAGGLWFKGFVLLSHASHSPTAVLLVLLPLPWCSHAQLSCSRDLPHPQACFWGHLLGLGGVQGWGYTASGDEFGATSKRHTWDRCLGYWTLGDEQIWSPPAVHPDAPAVEGCMCWEEDSTGWWVPSDQECPSAAGISDIFE